MRSLETASRIRVLLAILSIAALSACSGVVEATETNPPSATRTPVALPTEVVPTATAIPEPTATAAPTESSEFISPYTPSAPTGTGATLDPVVLRLNLELGAIYRIRTLTTQDLSQSFQGQSIDIRQKLGFEYTYTITTREPDESAWVDVTYTRALYESESPFGTDSFDSADPPGQIPDAAIGFAAVVGTGFSMRISTDGEILEIEGVDEMIDQMLSAMDLPDSEASLLVETTIRQQYSEQALKDQLGNLLFDFPEGALRVGDTWRSTQESEAMVPVVAESTYTLLDFDEQTALIEVNSEMSTGSGEGGLGAGLFGLDFRISGTQTGVIQVDLNTGLANSVIDQSLVGEMTIVLEGEEVSVPLNIQQTVQVESVQIAP